MLTASMLAYHREQEWRDYTAQILWSVGKLVANEYPFPSWAELHEEKPEEPNGEDVYETLIKRWGGD